MAHSSTSPNGDTVKAPGYQDTLERSTGRFASFAVAFAFVSIATGIFTTYGSVLKSSGPLGIWTWPFVIVGQLAVALLLGLKMPELRSIDAELDHAAESDEAGMTR